MKELIKKDKVKIFFKEKVANFFKNNGMLILFSVLLLWISLLLIQTADNYIMQDTFNQKPTSMLIPLFSEGFGTVAVWITVIPIGIYLILFSIIGKKELDLSKVFLIIAIPLGIIYMIISPLGRIPDENSHSRRAYEVSLGYLITDVDEEKSEFGRLLPKDLTLVDLDNTSYNIYKEKIDSLVVEETEEDGTKTPEEFLTFGNVAVYTFVSYVPQAIGIALSRIFTDNILVQMYVGRVFNFAIYVAIMYFSLKIIPFKKLAVFMIAFLPIAMQQAASLSPDALTNSLSIFFVSYVLHLIYREDKMTRKDYIILAISSILVAIIKIIYLPLCALVFLIPDKKFDTRKKKWIILIAIFIASVILNLAWLKFANAKYPQAYHNANQKEQIAFVLQDPYRYITTCFRDVHLRLDFYLFGLSGRDMSYIDIDISYIAVFTMLFLLVYSFIIDDESKIKPNWIVKGFFALIFLAIVALLFTSEYLTWNPVGNYWVNGIQPRYFIPMLLLIAVISNLSNIKMEKKYDYRYIYMLIISINLHAVITMVNIFMK